jgi:pyruvate/2-oxoglutarate/acetoin dehydrogenase E1 component/TPP-dependent pyruvate/acetoin dehydrogenase alpha subunit
MRDRFLAFVTERFPLASGAAAKAFDRVARRPATTPKAIAAWRAPLAKALRASIVWPRLSDRRETTPGVTVQTRRRQSLDELVEACDGFLVRESIAASLTPEEKLELLRGMLLTRAVDTRLKLFFAGSEIRHEHTPFQGKGFRSLGQEAIYAVPLRLRRGSAWRAGDGTWQGDVVGPIIRDAGAALAMRPDGATLRMILNAQMGKAGPPMDGRDLHIGGFDWGVLPASAPLSISSLTVAGMGLAFKQTGATRVAVSFIGEGGSSLGEWHEAINLCAARRLPVLFCLQNNQTALSTPVADQSAARVFADKAAGYGVPGLTIDGTDPEAIAAAFAWAAERARAGKGPALIELVAMRMCGHAHHDDMLYLGKEPPASWEYPPLTPQGYADADRYEFWRARDPIRVYAKRLEAAGLLARGGLDRLKRDAEAAVEAEAQAVIAAPWPDAATVTSGVVADDRMPRHRVEVLDRAGSEPAPPPVPPDVEEAPPFDKKGATLLDAVMLGVGDALAADPRVFVIGEDVGGKYGNAFLLLRPLLKTYGDRIINSTLAEGAVLGACVGAALAGLRPIGEMQFNDFVATGFNQLVNNAAKIRYRWGGSVPMVVRMPWGGLRHAGPYHSQNTEPWFYRVPGLKIVVPSTPHDARALMASAVADPDPVLYYEHITLYRDPRIKQRLDDAAPAPLPVGRAALRRAGDDLVMISYGAYVHAALRVAERLHESGIEASVLDLRWLMPLDREAVLGLARRTGRVLIVHEDSRTGGIGESVAAMIQEEAFEWLDAPVRVMGSLDTPVPYSPPLEAAFLPSEAEIEHAARRLAAY